MSRRAHISVTVKRIEENNTENSGERRREGFINDVDRKLRQLKKKIERERIFYDAKRQVYFEPKSQKRRKKYLRAVKLEAARLSNLNLGTSGSQGEKRSRG